MGAAPRSGQSAKIRSPARKLFLHFPFLAADDIGKCDETGGGAREPKHSQRAAYAMDRVAEKKGSNSKDERPDDAASGVEKQERHPSVLIDPGEQSSKDPQKGDEPSEKDDFRAVAREEILPKLKPFFWKVNEFSVAQKKFRAPGPAHPKADIIANDRPRRCAEDDAGNIEIAGRPGINGGENESRLSREGNARAFQHDDGEDDPVAVQRDKRLKLTEKHEDSGSHGGVVPTTPHPIRNHKLLGKPYRAHWRPPQR